MDLIYWVNTHGLCEMEMEMIHEMHSEVAFDKDPGYSNAFMYARVANSWRHLMEVNNHRGGDPALLSTAALSQDRFISSLHGKMPTSSPSQLMSKMNGKHNVH